MIVKTYDCSIIIVGFLGRNFATWREKKGGDETSSKDSWGKRTPNSPHFEKKKG
jgi:hypothetical protein